MLYGAEVAVGSEIATKHIQRGQILQISMLKLLAHHVTSRL
jgi:hypothetical protein